MINFDNIEPKLIVLTIGVNNFRYNTPQEIADGIKTAVNELRKKSPSSRILLLGPLPAGADNSDPLRITYNKVHELISNLGNQQNVTYRNIGKTFILDSGKLNYNVVRQDNIHLTPEGYYAWANSIQDVIDEVFNIN